jgi:hypothetical protein
MDFSFLKALRASVRLTLATLKRDSKRLHRATEDVFGHTYSLSTCQEAYARARGFRNWREAETILKRGGRDPSTPFWKIDSRTDFHETVFSSIVTAELEMTENGPVCFFGKQSDAIVPALCLWSESLSLAEVPGLVLVDTEAAALQDTSLWEAVIAMGLTATFDEFRFIDARSDNIPLAFSTKAADWVRSLLFALPEEARAELENSGFSVLLQSAIEAVAAKRGEEDGQVFADTVESVLQSLCQKSPQFPTYLFKAADDDTLVESLKGDFHAYIERQRPDAVAQLADLGRRVGKKGMRLGRHLAQESARRPTVVLYNAKQATSVVLASVVHSLYYWRYVDAELRHNDIYTRPVLFYSDVVDPQVPQFIQHSGASHTCIVNGPARTEAQAWPESQAARSRFVCVDSGSFVYAGRRTVFKSMVAPVVAESTCALAI